MKVVDLMGEVFEVLDEYKELILVRYTIFNGERRTKWILSKLVLEQ
jgi:hypothetical protein